MHGYAGRELQFVADGSGARKENPEVMPASPGKDEQALEQCLWKRMAATAWRRAGRLYRRYHLFDSDN